MKNRQLDNSIRIAARAPRGRVNDIDRLIQQRLKMRRIMLGLSLKETAKAIGVSLQQMQKYERAQNRISSGRLYLFSEFLQVPVSYFYENLNDIQNALGTTLSERAKNDQSDLSEKEVYTLIKAYRKIKDPAIRKGVTNFMQLCNSVPKEEEDELPLV